MKLFDTRTCDVIQLTMQLLEEHRGDSPRAGATVDAQSRELFRIEDTLTDHLSRQPQDELAEAILEPQVIRPSRIV